MVVIQNLVAIQGCDPNRNPGRNLRSRTFQGFQIKIKTLVETLAETTVSGLQIEIATLIETLIKTLIVTTVPGLRIEIATLVATLNRNLKALKFATLVFFLWLCSGLQTGF